MVRKCFLAGARAIDARKEIINDLNVFPVPDGDTGTNMTMTIQSAASEVAALTDLDMQSLCKAISSGSLRGARGNSGVILSQLLRGFTKEIEKEDLIDVGILTRAFERAVESAYKAVMKPKEGTILTVARAGADKALELDGRTDNLIEFMNKILMHMQDVLAQTPDMLPVLKEAGVVDSGGEGLITILSGAFDAFLGKEADYEMPAYTTVTSPTIESETATEDIPGADIKYGYCTEFIIMQEKTFTETDEIELKSYLASIGDSIVCVADDDIVKIHVHTNDPGLAIQKALTYGSLTRMKIDNMREEHHERVIKNVDKLATEQMITATASDDGTDTQPTQTKKYGFISVATGSGICHIFEELGVDHIIQGGQTMNPSTEDILQAIDAVAAKHIFIFPNNSNIILAAEQAKELTKDKDIIVIPSKNIPQGIAAMICFVEEWSPEKNTDIMIDAMGDVKSGQVTYAVRDTTVDGREIKEGDIMGLSDKTVEVVGADVVDTTIALLGKMLDEMSEIVTIYYGADGSKEDAKKIATAVEEMDDEIEVEIHDGGQPIYYYFVSVE